jgi:AraC-like DNA-binding protein
MAATPACVYGPGLTVRKYRGPYVSETSAAAQQTFLRLLLDAAPRLIGALRGKDCLNLTPRRPLRLHSLDARYGFDEPHRHAHVEVVLAIGNRCLLALGDRVHRFRAGEVSVLAPQQVHCDAFEQPSGAYDLLWYGLGTGDFAVHATSYVPAGPHRGFHRLGNLILPLKAGVSLADTLCKHPLSLDALKETLLYLTWRAVTAARQREAHAVGHPLVAEAAKIVAEEYTAPLSVAQVAHRLNITPNYLSMLFRRGKGTSFTRYVQRVRLTRGRALLEDPHLSIKAIGRDCGFQNAYYFTRLFKQTFGVSPTAYREAIAVYFV